MKGLVWLLALMLFSVDSPALFAQDYGRIRIQNQRAADVVRQRNDFVERVLTSYAIPHERNDQGVIVRIRMEGRWIGVTAIEILPMLKEDGEKRQQVAAHKLFFHTADGVILELLSELTIH